MAVGSVVVISTVGTPYLCEAGRGLSAEGRVKPAKVEALSRRGVGNAPHRETAGCSRKDRALPRMPHRLVAMSPFLINHRFRMIWRSAIDQKCFLSEADCSTRRGFFPPGSLRAWHLGRIDCRKNGRGRTRTCSATKNFTY